MSFIGAVSIPFEDCDTDTATIDATGAALSAIFTNLAIFKQREILLTNTGSQNLKIGKSLATARYNLAPGDSIRLAAKDLAKIFAKAASATTTADIFQAI